MIIGLHGESRVGKDSVAKILQKEEGYEWRSFASNLRAICLAINPYLTEIDMRLQPAVADYGWDWVKEYSYDSVEMMINLGQSARDLLDPDIWVTPVMQDLYPGSKVVISDVRQRNEAQAIKARGGQLWKIVRPGTVARGMDNLLDDYPFSLVIHNNGSLDDLAVIVRAAVK